MINDYPNLDPNALIYIPYPKVNCLKTIPFTAAHTYIAHIWQYPPSPGGRKAENHVRVTGIFAAFFFFSQKKLLTEVKS